MAFISIIHLHQKLSQNELAAGSMPAKVRAAKSIEMECNGWHRVLNKHFPLFDGSKPNTGSSVLESSAGFLSRLRGPDEVTGAVSQLADRLIDYI